MNPNLVWMYDKLDIYGGEGKQIFKSSINFLLWINTAEKYLTNWNITNIHKKRDNSYTFPILFFIHKTQTLNPHHTPHPFPMEGGDAIWANAHCPLPQPILCTNMCVHSRYLLANWPYPPPPFLKKIPTPILSNRYYLCTLARAMYNIRCECSNLLVSMGILVGKKKAHTHILGNFISLDEEFPYLFAKVFKYLVTLNSSILIPLLKASPTSNANPLSIIQQQ